MAFGSVPFLPHFSVLKYKKSEKISVTLKKIKCLFKCTSLLLYILKYVQKFKSEYIECTYISFEKSTGLSRTML